MYHPSLQSPGSTAFLSPFLTPSLPSCLCPSSLVLWVTGNVESGRPYAQNPSLAWIHRPEVQLGKKDGGNTKDGPITQPRIVL